MLRIRWILAFLITGTILCYSVQGLTSSQDGEVVTNKKILELVKVKMGDQLIIDLIGQSKTNFDTSVEAILQLKKAGVSDAVIQAMMARGGSKPIPSSESGGVSSGTGDSSVPPSDLPTEMGVYVKKNGSWVEVLPEVVNWKTGGVIKNLGTLGVIKKDINGRIENPHSRNRFKTPMEFLIIAPEGAAITEYQFLRLREKKDAREFRTVTGGVFNQSGGAKRDLFPFEGKKIAPRTFTVSFSTLPPGEYGFLPPGAFPSANAASSLGKMYTFNVGSEF